jgi:hypothetical protein
VTGGRSCWDMSCWDTVFLPVVVSERPHGAAAR